MPIAKDSFDIIADVVRGESAIVLNSGKEYLVEARLKPICKEEGLDSLEELARSLKNRSRKLVDRVVDALTTNETSFFRDQHPFDALKNHVLPRLVETRAGERKLDIWCGASSSGQEPLTIAMTIRENFPELADWRIKILATDISEEMLERCRSGLYSQLEVSRGLPARLLIKHFKKLGTRWQASEDLLSMIEYKQVNLAARLPFIPPMDIVFLRNVLIYFDSATKTKILTDVNKQLKPDGVLFLGTAESTIGLHTGFNPWTVDRTTCYRRAA